MQNNDYLINYYNEYDEEGRLANNRVKLVATDGASRYIRECLEDMDEETFENGCPTILQPAKDRI